MSSLSGHIKGIDGLRAFAVLAVIIFHLNPLIMPGGFSGVDVFFVISGYVVCGSLSRSLAQGFANYLFGFYSRRLVRIIPALFVCLMICSLICAVLVPASWLSTTTSKIALSAIFGFSNILLIIFNDGYFSPRVEFNFFTHTWSLGVEEQFYLLFPLMLYFLNKKFRNHKNDGFLVVAGVFGFGVVSLLWSSVETTMRPDFAYYLLPSRFWELSAGATLYLLHNRCKGHCECRWISNISLYFGIGLIFVSYFFSDPKSFPFPWAMVSVAGSVLTIHGIVKNRLASNCFVCMVLESRVFQLIGKSSYSLYLWHWPVFVLFRWTIGLDSVFYCVFACLIVFSLGGLSYVFIEGPSRDYFRKEVFSDKKIVVIGFVSSIVVFCLVGGIFVGQRYLTLSVTRDRMVWYPEAWESNLVYAGIKNKYSGKKLFVLGDSHAVAYSTILRNFELESGVEVSKYSKAGCAVANFIQPSSEECALYIDSSIAEIIRRGRAGDVVFLASLRMPRLGDQWSVFGEGGPSNFNVNKLVEERAFVEAKSLIRKIVEAGFVVVIDAPKPVFKSPAFRCSDYFNKNNPVCSGGFSVEREFLLNRRRPILSKIELVVDEFNGVYVWDPFFVMCPGKTCNVFDKNGPMFFDGDHLSAHGNRVLYPSFVDFFSHVWE